MTDGAKKITTSENLLGGVFSASAAVPFMLAMGVCSPFGLTAGAVLAVAASAFGIKMRGSSSYIFFLILLCASLTYGTEVAASAVILALLLTLLCNLMPSVKKPPKLINTPIAAGLMISTAFSLTAMQTTNYFGIGAEGNNVLEMLTSYRSLGFHANWRGVFYGTVVMVIMITFPRAFKAFSKKISPAFIAVAATLLLNLALNPASHPSAINEVGRDFSIHLGGGFSSLGLKDIPSILLIATAITVIYFYSLSHGESSNDKSGKQFYLTGIIVSALLCLPFVVERIPIHSLAVVIIVGAWQNVEWGKIAFSIKGGVGSGMLMIIAAVLPVVIGITPAVPILALLCLAMNLRTKKKISCS